ncbi:hypothetical protein [Burkholderia sp. Ac-20349]|uniref:hypothetical protein n=1 Tax=Burkholderia sp. Ac-20349 TaxID=2703893 RepID=UPI00197C002B|nr:hypothetical protein [Burkholderia sp. Ac-20349]MBN3839281.1 hypothetical protein [Burkholderia sp. Ac-20349]
MTTTTAATDDAGTSAKSTGSGSSAPAAPAASPAPNASSTTYTATGPQIVTEFAQNADEFCASLSAGDKRVELISAFHSMEVAAGRVRDVPSAYAARFQAFINQPA